MVVKVWRLDSTNWSKEIKSTLLLVLYEKPHEKYQFRVAVFAVEIPQRGDTLSLIKKKPEFRS
ncbi:hypothetical protein [Nostoc sp. FACHB-892]|uniref:hypothetical protein n=1 Tax=Nostoc sp. FACHB-892 TaxID=2692843 RepID=UPI001681FE22|nr:hypothetical protein [Nostoc sp. FACHB-892]